MTKWWPVEYADEVMPQGKDSANAWIMSRGSDGIKLYGGQIEGSGEGRAVRIGTVVQFIACDRFEDLQVHVTGPERFTIKSGAVVASANCFWEIGDIDTMMDSLAGFVRELAGNVDTLPVTATVGQSRWREPADYRLVLVGGVPAFTPCNPATGKH